MTAQPFSLSVSACRFCGGAIFFFHYLFANTLSAFRDGTFPVDFLFFKQPHGRRHYSIYSCYNVN